MGLGHSSSGHQKHLGVSIGSLLLSKGRDNIDKASVVLDATLRTASLLFLLLLLVNLDRERGSVVGAPEDSVKQSNPERMSLKESVTYLGGLSPHFSSTGQGAVNLA